MKFIKKNIKLIIGIIIGMTLVSTLSAYATYNYLASDVSYTKADGNKINVQDAINELYNNREFEYVMGENNRNSGTETIEIKHDNDNAMFVTGQDSLEYRINENGEFQTVNALGANNNGMGFYYSKLSVKQGDIIYIKRDTSSIFGYVLVY